MSAKIEDFDVDVSGIDNADLDINDMKSRIPSFSSEKLCEIIVCDRYFGCYKELAITCMEELANRRIKGNQFDFEKYIETSYGDLPKLDLSMPDVGDVLRKLTGSLVKR